MFGLWCLKSRLSFEVSICFAFAQAGWKDVPLPVMALVLDGIAAKGAWPLRTVGSRWAHAVRTVTAFEVAVQVKDHNLRAKIVNHLQTPAELSFGTLCVDTERNHYLHSSCKAASDGHKGGERVLQGWCSTKN